MGHDQQIVPPEPACCLPKSEPGFIILVDKNMTALDSAVPECLKALFDQRPADAAVANLLADCQVLQVTSPAVMTAEHRSNYFPFLAGYETHTRISL